MSYILLTWILVPIWWPVSLIRSWLQPLPQQILIAEIAGIGDVICSTAVFKAVRNCFPEAHIALMVDTVLRDLVLLDTNVDEVIPFTYGAQRGIAGRYKLMRLMSRFDTFICLIPSAAQISAACYAAMPRRYSVLPDISVMTYRLLSPLMTHTLAHKTNTSFVKTQLKLLAPLGVNGDPVSRSVTVTEMAHIKANALLSSQYKWIGLAIGSGQGIKAIHPQTLQILISGLLNNPGYGLVLIGGNKEQTLATMLIRNLESKQRERCINLTGSWGLDELPGLLVKLGCFIGVDSGITYMADALNVPIVYLPGPASPADQSPIKSPKITLMKNLDCAPCSRIFVTPKDCAVQTHACIHDILPTDILAAVNKLLGEV